MADVTRADFDKLVARVVALEATLKPVKPAPATPASPAPANPAPAKPPTAPAKPLLTLAKPAVKVAGASYTITATASATRDGAVSYLQIAVRGPGAEDLDYRPGATFKQGNSITLTGTQVGVDDGSYSAHIAYSEDGKTWVDGPVATWDVGTAASTSSTTPPVVIAPAPVPTTPVPTTPVPTAPGPTSSARRVPLAGKSGLPFNSLVFRQDPGEATAFGKNRGLDVDGLMWFTSRDAWDELRTGWDGKAAYLASGHLVLTALPHAPQSEGDQMNAKGANDAYRDQQRALGKWLAEQGLNSPLHYLRVDWECNGDWYAWSANQAGGAAALRQAYINFVTNVRAGGATKVGFDLCWNKGPSQSGHDFDIFPGAQYCDVVAVDQYDQWSPAVTDSQWKSEINKTPGLQTVADFAKKNGVMWALDEGGNTHPQGDTYGGDNPFYWQKVRDFIAANTATCAWHVTYDDRGAPDTLRHDWAANPNSYALYKKLWKS